ncbi:hypothetical protein [Bacillus weihaiensis]|uniref:DUF8042 domain-containing protein n=1 Tax=Bacillus weihaiensis TaxID=1547283 RepID=A0A1L3MMK6_9BACI|nr:hypothetical protein [Bacillus weihaiensis]APH03590.1 hypothetical protein A9C19_01815 [Bacillus weihaiensis]
MVSLSNEQYEMIHFYYNLLNTIEEGFEYIVSSFDSFQVTEAETILKDILSAFYHVDSSNKVFETVLKEEEVLIEKLRKFDQVIMTVDADLSIFTSFQNNQELIKHSLAPCFIAWKELVQHELKPYIIQ